MSSLVKKGSPQDITLIEYVPTVEDLQEIFKRVQPPDKVPVDVIKCAVQAQPVAKRMQLSDAGLYVSGPLEEPKTVGYITLKKFRENDADIWLYEGKVKA